MNSDSRIKIYIKVFHKKGKENPGEKTQNIDKGPLRAGD